MAPLPTYPTTANSGAAWGATYGPDVGFRTAPWAMPYYPWGYYGLYPDPYGGGLTGAANAIAAQGQFEKDFHAWLMKVNEDGSFLDPVAMK